MSDDPENALYAARAADIRTRYEQSVVESTMPQTIDISAVDGRIKPAKLDFLARTLRALVDIDISGPSSRTLVFSTPSQAAQQGYGLRVQTGALIDQGQLEALTPAEEKELRPVAEYIEKGLADGTLEAGTAEERRAELLAEIHGYPQKPNAKTSTLPIAASSLAGGALAEGGSEDLAAIMQKHMARAEQMEENANVMHALFLLKKTGATFEIDGVDTIRCESPAALERMIVAIGRNLEKLPLPPETITELAQRYRTSNNIQLG